MLVAAGCSADDPGSREGWDPAWLVATDDFPERWHCGSWTGLHGWTHIVADIGIWVAYMAIPLLLLALLRGRRDVPFPRVLHLFVAFIVLCGLTHLLEATMFWWPAYRLMGLVKVVTAIVSLLTVGVLAQHLPRVFQLRSPEQLEREVALRTQELEQARGAAQQAAEARARFTANVSHELRTPLSAVLGYTDVLAADPALGREQQHHVQVIQRNGKHLLSIINDVLDLARSEAGKLPISLEPCRIEQLLRDCIDMLAERAESKGLRLELALPAEPLPPLQLDPVRVRQIVINVVGNAIKFTDRGGVRIELRAEPVDAGMRLQIDVTDTGIGMTPGQVERAFDEFTQGDSSLTRRFGGSGLGLTLSRRLSDAMDGELHIVASAPGQGTTMRFALTTAVAADAPGIAATTDGAPVRLDGARILLAEDARDTALLVQRILTAAGADVTCVDDGRKAIGAVEAAAAANEPFDLALMDVQMPGMDGLTATRTLRARGHALPICALTAHADAEHRAASLAAGCDGHLTKPIRNTDLLRTLRDILASRSGNHRFPTRS